ncbi:hypothetical protein ASF79_12955 [Agreia sp. Leaf335]|uniref:DUF7882 family protein n=1 Tax=Agreia sp. Leaf335 TaxID=1736340 RepID=UPI0006FE3437|nr:hypothetical protein [Agreia sp. Leaf335]KQR20416.1 hypothetical protein ASF79_12955 [Agreia sp. Leaf335]
MGQLIYNHNTHVELDDRTLAHLQLVITAKLRRSENNMFSWGRDPADGSGRESVWIAISTPLEFRYRRKDRSPMNRAWVDALMVTANSPGGLVLVSEPLPT